MVFIRLACVAFSVLPGTLGAIVDLPAAIIGTYNVSLLMGAAPTSFVQSLLPETYRNSLIRPNASIYPGLAADSHPIVFELGREANAGPPLLNFISFEEAKIQIPYVARIGSSPTKPFLYKRRIMVDNAINVAGSWIAFGLNTTLNKFIPANSSDSSSYDYQVEGVLKAKVQPATSGSIPLESFKIAAGLPWFAEFLTCAQHFYNFTNPVERVSDYNMPRHSSATTVDPAVSEQLKAFNDTVTKRAEEIVFKVFPQKILTLNQKIEECSTDDSHLHAASIDSATDTTIYSPLTEPPTKKRRHENGDSVAVGGVAEVGGGPRFTGRMVANHKLRTLHDGLKNEYMELVNLCVSINEAPDKVKLWVNLTMPKIEDGDNFGVQIQEEVLNELHRAQDSGYNLRDAVSKSHHINRAKICSKILKYPHIEDYAIALQEHDEKQFYMALRNLIDLRNIYAVLTDVIHKNFQKIRAPKGNNGAAMY
ncbi:proteasome (prosome, macropain) activator subunit 3 (PA28 gamma [Rhizoctonia solani AG-1 IB]|uniref:Proteasome (Prosome, macropain) activator subunit 3 (PA28 gamma) n=1 Tax=Thanatephorus cucumeris (strain AG1-IB / isolate 7/3/14) TaxID=1108050 RepID=M5C6B8_THACB|nr:proteasome (prosome, macropain) activator subunit 3 (PA28 gamma [Rhizoctonia solani AG-1 IB]